MRRENGVSRPWSGSAAKFLELFEHLGTKLAALPIGHARDVR